ncbi:MAG: hypothetical protein ACNA77_08130 [Opitutales bacterium]
MMKASYTSINLLHKATRLTCCLGFALASGLWAAPVETAVQSADTETKEKAAIERLDLKNDFIHLSLDLKARNYSIHDSRTGAILLEAAPIKIEMEKGAEVTLHREEAVSDALGEGRRIILAVKDYGLYRYATHFRSGVPPRRLLSFTLYEDHPALILGFGLLTPNYYSMRLREAEVLSGEGKLFGGARIKHPLTLNGAAGAVATYVLPGLDRISSNSLMLTGTVRGKQRTVVWGGLGQAAYGKVAKLEAGGLRLWAEDPVGVLVDEDQEFLSEDTFYLDLTGTDPFEALERYGLALRTANNASPNVHQSPVLCGWSVGNISKLPDINNSAKLVEEADHAQASGITKYTTPMNRLEPDKYYLDSQQGWWDDERFLKYGHLVPPYPTLSEFTNALEARGALGYIYMQLGMPSDDFARAHPEWMLFNDASEVDRHAPGWEDNPKKHSHHQPYVTFDYTDKGFSEHFVKVWSAIREAGIRGVKVDYPATAWRPEGGFDDRYASTNSAYLRAFELLREAMGEEALIDERNLGESGRPCLDLTAGVIDTQRTWADSNAFVPEMVSRSGLRWYKNRTVFNYYSDTKAVHGLEAADLQSLITLNFLTSGRLDLATSYSLFTPEITHIVSRSFPHYAEPISARPLDAFTGVTDPQVYELELTPDWRQVTFYNTGEEEAVISTALSGDRIDNAIGLDRRAVYHAYEFWTDTYLGKLKGRHDLKWKLAPGHCAMISVRRALEHPQVLSTNRHLLQGWVDLDEVRWDGEKKALQGTAKVIGGETFRIVVAGNGTALTQVTADRGSVRLERHPDAEDLWVIAIDHPENGEVQWTVR